MVTSIAYTYGEPVVFTEYVKEISRLSRSKGLKNVVVTNGYYNEKPLTDLCRLVDAVKVDLKAFEDSYYRKICGATLTPVLDSLVTIKKTGVWLEIVYLMIPTLNDSPEKIREMSRWIYNTLGPDVPVHYSRFMPDYLLKNLPPTPVSSLETARDISLEEGIRYVYIGNVTGHIAESTYCPFCGKKIVSRRGYIIESMDIVDGDCRFCGKPIAGIWSEGNR
jgi:pyruvate formate lyase activating enzyme